MWEWERERETDEKTNRNTDIQTETLRVTDRGIYIEKKYIYILTTVSSYS